MLSKLIKYDIKSTWRNFAAIYMSILLGVIIVPLIFNNINNQIVNMLAGFLAFGIVVAVIVVMITTLFRIFNTNVFSREGYLTMTLPVKSFHIVLSKLIVSSMWIVLTGIVSVIGIFIFVIIIDLSNITEIAAVFQLVISHLDGQSILAIILLILAVIITAVKEVAKLFLSCSIAHLKQLRRLRVPAGIISYFVFSWAEVLILQVIAQIAGLISPAAGEFMRQLETMHGPMNIEQSLGLFNGVMVIGMLYALLLTATYSIGTVWILNHKLDLD